MQVEDVPKGVKDTDSPSHLALLSYVHKSQVQDGGVSHTLSRRIHLLCLIEVWWWPRITYLC